MKRALLFPLLILLLALGAARAEPARVLTPGGPVKLRREASSRARLVVSVPNRSAVEVTEAGEEWCKVTWKTYHGYIQTEFLLLTSDLPGKTVYGDEGALLLRAEAEETAPVTAAVSACQAVTVRRVEGDWALAEAPDGTEGWLPAAEISLQSEAPAGDLTWLSEPGRIAAACGMTPGPKEDGGVLADLLPGTAVTVTAVEKARCLVRTEAGWGWVPTAAVCLDGVPDQRPEEEPAVSAADAETAAVRALKKKYADFGRQELYCLAALCGEKDGLPGPLWHCAFYNDDDHYRYAALVDAGSGRVLFTADRTAFAAPAPVRAALPLGEVRLTLSADLLAVGDVLDAEAAAWTDAACAWSLALDGQPVFDGAPGGHFAASYRPRQAGDYVLTVTVSDPDGRSASASAAFSVDPSLTPGDGPARLYSQKDGWWADKAYADRDLQKSGCAIFTLAHALTRMGVEGGDTAPEALARKYGACLTPAGTNNERLIRTAGADFGYKTQADLIDSKNVIIRRLRDGDLFSFAIVFGHIALIDGISEDGTMLHISDSAPSATFERIKGGRLYIRTRSGSFRAVQRLDEIPDARWYFETDAYGGLEYWLKLDYVAPRGVRLIQPEKNAGN